MNGLASFEKDHGEWFGLKVSRTQLDEGRGIAETIQAHNAKYHKVYKTYCSNSRLNSFTDKNDSADPKKFSFTVSALQKYPCCIWCDGQDIKNLFKIETDHVDTNVKAWTERTDNSWLLGKPISQAAYAYAGDTYYHLQWYLQLKDLARAEDRRVSAGPSVLTFTSVAIAQIVALSL